MPIDLEASKARHARDLEICDACQEFWPCDAVQLIAEVEALRAELANLQEQHQLKDAHLRDVVRRREALRELARMQNEAINEAWQRFYATWIIFEGNRPEVRTAHTMRNSMLRYKEVMGE